MEISKYYENDRKSSRNDILVIASSDNEGVPTKISSEAALPTSNPLSSIKNRTERLLSRPCLKSPVHTNKNRVTWSNQLDISMFSVSASSESERSAIHGIEYQSTVEPVHDDVRGDVFGLLRQINTSENCATFKDFCLGATAGLLSCFFLFTIYRLYFAAQ